jgi:hypothetical protein
MGFFGLAYCSSRSDASKLHPSAADRLGEVGPAGGELSGAAFSAVAFG